MPYWWEWFIWIKSHCHPQVMLCYTSISALSWWPHYQSFIDLATVTAPQGMLAQQMPPSGANFIVSTLLGRTPDHVPICILFRKDEKGRKTGKKSEPTNSWFFFNRYFVFSSKQLSSHSLSLFSTELLNQPLRCHRKLWEEKKDLGNFWDWSMRPPSICAELRILTYLSTEKLDLNTDWNSRCCSWGVVGQCLGMR